MSSEFFKLIKNDPHTWSVPNLISISRLLFLPVICYAIALQSRTGNIIAVLFLGISGSTDFFDGYLARKLNQCSHLGRMLDPVLDKITVGIVIIFLAAYRQLPYWYVVLVIGRDLLILIAALTLISRIKIVAESNFLGKWTLGSFLFVILFYTLNWHPFNVIALWISALLVPTTLISYLRRSQKMMRSDH